MLTNKITINHLLKKKIGKEKITALTAYDASFAKIENAAGIDVILVGDSLGNVIQGHHSTVPVTIDEMVYHTRCVSRGNSSAFLIGDMPFASYPTPLLAFDNAKALLQAGAEMVKMEGGRWLEETVRFLFQNGIPVCAHLGLQPQSVNTLGGYKKQGKTEAEANLILNDAMVLEKAGAQLLVLECVPDELAQRISETLTIPVIGIGAGPHCDGQILVVYDILGLKGEYIPKFSKNFLSQTNSIEQAIQSFITEVRSNTFPTSH